MSSEHSCVNWDTLEDWVRERQIPRLREEGYIRHPKFGNVFGEEFKNELGVLHDG